MVTKERAADRGRRDAARQIADLGAELRNARLSAGVSQADVGRAAGVTHSAISRIERGVEPYVSIRRVATVASIVGLRLSVRVYPSGLPIRDAAQIALLTRLRERLHPSLTRRTEVPIPIEGDLRAWDASIGAATWTAYVDAETRVRDAQALARRTSLKRRDTRTDRVLLLLADTRSNRTVLRTAGSMLIDGSISSTEIMTALSQGMDPGGSGIVLL